MPEPKEQEEETKHTFNIFFAGTCSKVEADGSQNSEVNYIADAVGGVNNKNTLAILNELVKKTDEEEERLRSASSGSDGSGTAPELRRRRRSSASSGPGAEFLHPPGIPTVDTMVVPANQGGFFQKIKRQFSLASGSLHGFWGPNNINTNIDKAIDDLLQAAKDHETQCVNTPPDESIPKITLNVTGWSRGAVACEAFISKLSRRIRNEPRVRKLLGKYIQAVNIFGIDPVPGLTDRVEYEWYKNTKYDIYSNEEELMRGVPITSRRYYSDTGDIKVSRGLGVKRLFGNTPFFSALVKPKGKSRLFRECDHEDVVLNQHEAFGTEGTWQVDTVLDKLFKKFVNENEASSSKKGGDDAMAMVVDDEAKEGSEAKVLASEEVTQADNKEEQKGSLAGKLILLNIIKNMRASGAIIDEVLPVYMQGEALDELYEMVLETYQKKYGAGLDKQNTLCRLYVEKTL